MSTILVLVALADEIGDVLAQHGAEVVVTGVGKINAAYATARAIALHRPALCINFGTAGSASYSAHTLVECTRFVQRDMDVTPLGFARGVTPFDAGPAVLQVPRRLPALAEGICGSGDNFETSLGKEERELVERPTVIDMEAYAIAKVCLAEGLPFVSVKYITDGGDEQASDDWASNLPRAAARFVEAFEALTATLER